MRSEDHNSISAILKPNSSIDDEPFSSSDSEIGMEEHNRLWRSDFLFKLYFGLLSHLLGVLQLQWRLEEEDNVDNWHMGALQHWQPCTETARR